MKKVLILFATLFIIGCNWGDSGCENCSCSEGCCSSGSCDTADCTCDCNK